MNIKILVLVPAKGPLTCILEEKNIDYIVIRYMGWLGRKKTILKGTYRALVNAVAYIRLIKKLKAVSIDLIYTNTVYSPLGAMLSSGLGVPHIWHIHEFVHEDLDAKYDLGTNLSMKLINKTSAKVICNSVAVCKKMANYIPMEKLAVVYNGFPEFNERPQGKLNKNGVCVKEKLRLCIIGSLHPGKGHIDAIQALHVLANDGVDAELRIVGTGNKKYIRRLETLANKLGVSDRISWVGFMSNPIDVFTLSDITLVCSKSEAFGRVAVEAMSVGCPVVGTNSGGLPEIIEDNVNGLLYQPGDYKMLAAQILRLKDRELYQWISKNAISSVYKRFTMDRCVSDTESIIRKVVS